MENIIKHPLSPIIDENSKILILGSFPSVKSRQLNFYYANKNNRFWKIMNELFHEEINDKELFCHKHHIALWDVISSCTIDGSKDSSIDNVQVNDINQIIKNTNIKTIFTTGKKAFNLYLKYVNCSIKPICLPSSSSANAQMSLNDLIDAYHIIVEKIYEES